MVFLGGRMQKLSGFMKFMKVQLDKDATESSFSRVLENALAETRGNVINGEHVSFVPVSFYLEFNVLG